MPYLVGSGKSGLQKTLFGLGAGCLGRANIKDKPKGIHWVASIELRKEDFLKKN
jgi:hypothetical protein